MRGNNYNFSYYDYNEDILRLKSDETIKREYIKLRRIAVKRLQRLAESGFTQSSLFRYYNNIKVLPTYSSIKNKKSAVHYLSDVMRFLSKPTSTVRGIKEYRREKISQMRSHGYDVNEQNFDAFVSYMSGVREFNRTFGISESMGSPKEAEYFFTVWQEFYNEF